MVEVKLILACAIVIACTLSGRAFADAASRRANTLTELAKALSLLQIQIVHMLQPLNIALQRTENIIFIQIAEKLQDSETVIQAWHAVFKSAAKRGGYADCLHKTEINALNAMFEALGQSVCRGEAALIHGTCEIIEQCRDEAIAENLRSHRLYVSIGALSGLAIAILLI